MSEREMVNTAAEQPTHVLVADDDADLRELLQELLIDEGFKVSLAVDGDDALKKARELRPDLVLLDLMMPRVGGADTHIALREDFRTRFTPVVIVTASGSTPEKVRHLTAGADDYITKPFDAVELVARVRSALRRSQRFRALNPLTGMPGNLIIAEEMEERLRAGRPFACVYVDLDNFKSYNDHYGFSRGDSVIAAVARIIIEVLEAGHSPELFAGHIGGDDFVALCEIERAETFASTIAQRFDDTVPGLYDAADRAAGHITVKDRQGNVHDVPFVSVSIGIAHARPNVFRSAAEVASVATEMKKVAKGKPGSAWAVDRRYG